jgi:hypothetical protein
MAHVLILYKLKPGVTREDFEGWLRTNNSTALHGIKRLKDFAVYRVEKRVLSPGEASADYFDLYDIPDIAGFVSEDIPSAAVRKDMEEFQGFAQSPEYLLATQVTRGPESGSLGP